jgi:hypothetical protein
VVDTEKMMNGKQWKIVKREIEEEAEKKKKKRMRINRR